jgi:carboxylate-amine ligase
MTIREPSFTIGIEEEYLLVNQETRDLAQEPPPALLSKCEG